MRARLRPVDLAREHGLSTQAVRNYEEMGILPRAQRTETGYRSYIPLHAQALRTFLALIPGHGHSTATAILQAVNRGASATALELLDESHTQLNEDRHTLTVIAEALYDLARSRDTHAEASTTYIGPLARQLRLRPATLRKWESAGLLRPRRDPQTGYRVYSPADVRDAQLVGQLRRAGYLLGQIAAVLAHIRTAGSPQALEETLRGWQERLTERGRALLRGAAQLEEYLNMWES